MAKLNWEISRAEYGHQFNIVANTRVDAIAQAEAQWLSNMDWEIELVGQPDEDGNIFQRSAVPDFVAKKVASFH